MGRPLLDGLEVRLVADPGRAVELATAHLRSLGVAVTASGPSGCADRVVSSDASARRPTAHLSAPVAAPPASDPGAGLPTATLDLATGLALAAGVLAAARLAPHGGARRIAVDPDAVTAHVLLPLVLGAGDPGPPAAPPRPRPTADGAVCADLAVEDDEAAFARLLRTGPGAGGAPRTEPGGTDELLRRWGSEDLAAAAQEWRLPVTPYRRRPAAPDPTVLGSGATAPTGPSEPLGLRATSVTPPTPGRSADPELPLEGLTLVDLTIMWSGPLATWLLQRLGARVIKVEPDCRLDGTRFSPGGRLFEALNAGKERAPLDLRRAPDRRAFRDLVASADLVVDNFSPRVPPNLGTTHRDLAAINPMVASLSLPAFPPGPQRDWVSYGTGVHAASGLGDTGGTGAAAFAPPIVTYPDPLGGLTAAVAALALLLARDRGGRPGHAEVALADAVAPLRTVPDDGALLRRPDPMLPDRLAARLGTPPPSPLRVEEDR